MTLAVLATAMYAFARVAGLLTMIPVFSARGVPRHVPVLGALIVVILVSPGVPVVDPPTTLGALLLAIASEAGLGLLMGGSVRIVFGAIAMASEIMSMQIGLGGFQLLNPLMETQEGPIGTLSTWLAGLVFLGAGLHLRCLEILGASFQVLTPGDPGSVLHAAPRLAELLSEAFSLGFQLAAPTLTLAWLINVFIALLSKLAPRMNVFFSIGISVGSPAGMAIVGLALPWILFVHRARVADVVQSLVGLLEMVG